MPISDEIFRAFGDRAFLVSDAQTRGFGRGALQSAVFDRPYRGVRTHSSVGTSLYRRALAYAPLLRPNDRFSHTTALALFGCPIRVVENAPVDIETAPGASHVRRSGIASHRSMSSYEGFWLEVPTGEAFDSTGSAMRIPIAPPHLALRQAAIQLPGPEIVVACDFLARADHRHFDSVASISLDALRDFSINGGQGRGAPRLRIGAALARNASESRMETLTRLAAEQAGLRDLELQVKLYDAAGVFIGRFDLVHRASRSLFEYDGEQHQLDRRQYLKDIVRLNRARECGWRILQIHREDFFRRANATNGEAEPAAVSALGKKMIEFIGSAPRPPARRIREFLAEHATHPTVAT